MTGAIKNGYGILPRAQKAMMHKASGGPDCFHEIIVEVFRLRVPDLFIVDAVIGMEGNGPASPDVREIGLHSRRNCMLGDTRNDCDNPAR